MSGETRSAIPQGSGGMCRQRTFCAKSVVSKGGEHSLSSLTTPCLLRLFGEMEESWGMSTLPSPCVCTRGMVRASLTHRHGHIIHIHIGVIRPTAGILMIHELDADGLPGVVRNNDDQTHLQSSPS